MEQNLLDLLKDRRVKALLRAVDRLAEEDQLAAMTTKLLARLSKVSEGVMFRLLPNKETILQLWLYARCRRLRRLIDLLGPGRAGLLDGLQRLAEQSELLALLFTPPMSDQALRLELLRFRDEIWEKLFVRIELLPGRPLGVPSRVLMDSLWQSLARLPRGVSAELESQEIEMSQLPWEERSTEGAALPSAESVNRLALNSNGFVFDPVSGRSFSVNDPGLVLLKLLQQGLTPQEVVKRVVDEYQADPREVERDLFDFARLLKGQLK